MLSGPLCHSPQQPAGELAPRPVRDRNGCLYYVVAGGSRVCISPVLRNRQMPTESSPGGVYSGSGDPRVGRPALVSSPAGPPNRIPSAIAVTRSAPSGSLQQGTPTSATRSTPASRLETIRETHLAEGISEQTSELIQSGWSKGTNTVYQSGWARWSSWCALVSHYTTRSLVILGPVRLCCCMHTRSLVILGPVRLCCCMHTLGFELYQWNTQRVSRNIITNSTRAQRARS